MRSKKRWKRPRGLLRENMKKIKHGRKRSSKKLPRISYRHSITSGKQENASPQKRELNKASPIEIGGHLPKDHVQPNDF